MTSDLAALSALGRAYLAALVVETERSLRASSADWCPKRCVASDGLPWACDHGQPLPNELRWDWADSTDGRNGRSGRAALPARPGGTRREEGR